MSESQENPPTLASLRARRASVRSPKSSQPSSASQTPIQTGLLFTEPPPLPPPPLTTTPRIWSVYDLVANVRQQVETTFTDVWVQGEISNCRIVASGHAYFTLKDGAAQISVVLFRRHGSLLRFRPTDGLAVLARGRISVYESRGQLQLIAETLEPRGAGALQLAFEQLKARLLAEGLFDAARKRPLPPFPRCVGIVTSSTGAVLRDILTVLRRRHARLSVILYPATVQGPTAPRSVAAGIRWFNNNPTLVDLIVIARGGGSIEDLSAFNDERLARLIAASKLPIVSAIGHETDFTIADFVSDLRAPTPSAAAELVTAAQHRIEERVSQLDSRLHRSIRFILLHTRQRYSRLSAESLLLRLHDAFGRREQRIDELVLRSESAAARRIRTAGLRLSALDSRLQRQHPSVRLAHNQRRFAQASDRLHALAASTIATHRARLDRANARLEAMSPYAVLSRGYAIVYAADGTLLQSSTDTSPGQTIRARLSQGILEAQVTDTKPLENTRK